MFGSIDDVLPDIRAGKMLVLVDEAEGGSGGVLCLAAERVTPDAISFMAVHARGLVCVALTEGRMRHLGIPLLANPAPSRQPAFGASIEAHHGVTTGISAADRARTIRVTVADGAGPGDLVMPGHVFPIQVEHGGVLAKMRHPEGAVDLMRLAGLRPAAVLCAVLSENGAVATLPELEALAGEHDLAMTTLPSLAAYRLRSELLVERTVEADFTSATGGSYRAIIYRNSVDRHQHMALVKGVPQAERPGSGAGALAVSHRRRLRLRALRLRRAAPSGDAGDRVRRHRA